MSQLEKGMERLRKTIDEWKNSGGNCDERMPWNSRQKANMKTICEQINEWEIAGWPIKYKDKSTKHPIFLVDSHQLKDDGTSSGRYKKIIPCHAFVTANELADKVCSNILGVEGGNLMLKTIDNPPDIKYPPG